ncbi:MAG: hypothetical protein COA36_07585 [Desulfotalea sp.]|nr:MAG: hypothetical protein COA36_07585 [Desulfotalea sp.]
MSYCLSLLERSVYVGRYSWDGIKTDARDPIAWSAGTYDIKIYKRPSRLANVELLKPHVCVYSKTGIGQSISANPEKFAQHICYDFSLHIERVIWVENLLSKDRQYDIIRFKRIRKIGATIFYKTVKRRAGMDEILQIENELKCLPFL